MSHKIKIEVDMEDIKNSILQLSEDEREKLFFEINPILGKALKKMEDEVVDQDNDGKTIDIKGA